MIRAIKTRLKAWLSPKYKYLNRFHIAPGAVVIDLGANVGEVSEYFLNRGAVVHAYEPNPHAYEVLHHRLHKNSRIHLHQAAVSNTTGTAKLWLHRDHQGEEVKFSQAGSLKAEKNNLSSDFIEVPVTDIKAVLGAHDHIALLKIDIEGGEYDIMDEVLAQAHKIDHILLETHEKKSEAFRLRNDELLKAIAASGHGQKICLDWF